MLLSRTPVLAIALVAERSRSWVIDYPAVITAAAGARGGGNPPDRDRTPRGIRRAPEFDIVIRPWNGPPPGPFAILREELRADPTLARLREPEPEPDPKVRAEVHQARWDTIRTWIELYDSWPAVARQVLVDSWDTFEWRLQ